MPHQLALPNAACSPLLKISQQRHRTQTPVTFQAHQASRPSPVLCKHLGSTKSRTGIMSGARRSSALAAGPDPLDEAKAAAMAANTLPEGVSSEDLRKFYEIVDSQTWQEVQGKVMAMMQNGELTEGIVKAGNSVLDEALRRNEDPRIISSLEDAVALLNSAQSMASAPAGLRIADECANMMLAHGSPQAARPGIEKMLTGIFADPEMDVTANSLLEDVQGFLSNLEQQDEQFQEMVEKVTREGPEEEAAQLKEYSQARAAALRNLIALRDIIKDMQ